ncbi:Dps family protein [Bacillus spongiae]|uniref:Dps family protein n=1 Tax=Bacillus spongiae TaxID=2683610 RepID=A0ABU8H989_9BACI
MVEKLKQCLNNQIANWTVLYTKLHNYHWYVKGDQFFTLHEKFEEFYNEAGTYIDDLAERLLSIGGEPVATLSECLKNSSIQEARNNEGAAEMVKSLVGDFTLIIEELKKGMKLAEEAGDESTGDMLLAIHASLEKQNWMLKAFLGEKI